jgi:hypothetical protein
LPSTVCVTTKVVSPALCIGSQYVLPTADGSAGQLMCTNGSGALAFATATAGVTLAGSTNNTIATVTGANALAGEANLTFDGSLLTVTGTADVSGDFTAGTVNADGDTAASDNAAMGYTAAEGLILTGQGSTSDVTIKNDADATVLNIPTGTTNVGIGVNPTYYAVQGRLMTRGGYTALTSGIGDSTVFVSGANSYSGKANSGGVLAFGGEYDSSSNITHWAGIAGLANTNTNGDYGGYMAFYTRVWGAAAVERMRITSAGKVGIGMTPGYALDTLGSENGGWGARIGNAGNSTPYGLWIRFTAGAPNNTSQKFIDAVDTGASRFIVWSNGNVQNVNNSYGATSDLKLKQDIADARSYWDDFKAVKFRKFRLKSDVLVDADAPAQLGVVAQELETVFPSLVYSSPDMENQEVPVLDEDGNATFTTDDDGNEVEVVEEKMVDIGTTTKNAKYSILSQIGLKVIQELQTRLEAAEAEIAILKG